MNMLIMWLLIPVLIMLLIGAAMAAICGFAYGLYLMVKGSMVIYSGLPNLAKACVYLIIAHL